MLPICCVIDWRNKKKLKEDITRRAKNKREREKN